MSAEDVTLTYVRACARARHLRRWWSETWSVPSDGEPEPWQPSTWQEHVERMRPPTALRQPLNPLRQRSNVAVGDLFNCGDDRVQVGVVTACRLNVAVGSEPYFGYEIAGHVGGHWFSQRHDKLTENGHFVFLPCLERLLWLAGFPDLRVSLRDGGLDRAKVELVAAADRRLADLGAPP